MRFYKKSERQREKPPKRAGGIRDGFTYGCGSLGETAISSTANVFILYYYTDVVGANAAIVGVLMLIACIVNGGFDVVMGLLVDRTKSRFGRARPWLLYATVPFAVSGVLLFSLPDLGNAGTYIYIFLSYNLYNFAQTAVEIPFRTLNSLITRDRNRRSSLNIVSMFVALAGSLAISNYTLRLVSLFGDTRTAWGLVLGIYGLVSVLLLLVAFAFIRETTDQTSSAGSCRPVRIREELRACIGNRYWLILFAFAFISYILKTVSRESTVYFAKYVLGDRSYLGVLKLAVTVPTMAGLLFLSRVVKRRGKRNSIMVSLAISIAGYLVIFISPYTLAFAVVGNTLRGLGSVASVGSSYAMLADSADYGERKTGIRADGLMFSLMSVGKKLGSGVGSALAGLVLSFGETDTVILSLYVVIPVAFLLLQLLLLVPYNLEKKYTEAK